MERVLTAMSGGVDSSVAAFLLAEQGYDVTGVMMKLFENEDVGADVFGECVALPNKNDAETVAAILDIPFYVFNYAKRFRASVMEPFAATYEKGSTPNPCVECNRHLKFGALLEKADAIKCGYVATGHYIRTERAGSGRYLLKKGVDLSKDQSYMMFFLSQDALARVLFPLGELTKDEVRGIAAQKGFPNAKRSESQDICFIPNGGYGAFLDKFTGSPAKPGKFIDKNGNTIGEHRGTRNYTIGQRRGLGISSAGRLFVTDIDAENNTVTLGDNGDLFKRSLIAGNINLIPCDTLDAETRLEVKIRYSHKPQPAVVRQTGDDELTVVFDEPQRAVTTGQYAVLYDGDTVVGGGVIESCR